jgi:hypothetical protein
MQSLGRRELADDTGTVVVLVAGGVLALLLMAVFVIDVSSWWTHKRHLQLQADAAALAGGALFGECFNGGGAGAAQADMEAEATKYSGGPGSAFNEQIGGSPQSQVLPSYLNPAPCTPSVAPGDSDPSYWFHVKMTDTGTPLLLATMIPDFVAPTITANARVQLFQAQTFTKHPPVVIPDICPKHVFVTVWNATTGGSVSTYELSGAPPCGTPSGDGKLNMWTASGITPPANAGNATIGVRVGFGQVAGSCGPGDGMGGAGWLCYDGTSATAPLTVLRSYAEGSPGAFPCNGCAASGSRTTPPANPAILSAATTGTCSGSPFFSDFNSASLVNGMCSTTFQATIAVGSCGLTTATCTSATVSATDQDGPVGSPCALSFGQTTTCSFNTSYPPGEGQEAITLSYSYTLTPNPAGGSNKPTYTNNGPCNGNPPSTTNGNQNACTATFNFPPAAPTWSGQGSASGPVHQEAYSADSDVGVTGPIKVLSISPCCTYSQSSAPSLSITVGLTAALVKTGVPSDLIFLRLSSGSRNKSALLDCQDGQSSVDQFINGCSTTYQVNPTGVCDPPDGLNPPDCIALQPGGGGITIKNALDQRFATCPPVVYPGYASDDPRLTQLIITDYAAYANAKSTDKVPIIYLGGFYITGWGFFTPAGHKKNPTKNLGCPDQNDPPPDGYLNSTSQAGFSAMWGHFVEYVNTNNHGARDCTVDITPCTPQMTR